MEIDRIAQLAAVRRVTGEHVFLKVGEELLAAIVGDDQVMVLVKAVQLKPLARGFKVVATGTRLITFNRTDEGWTRETRTVWDEDFDEPYELDSFGGPSPEEYVQRRAFEDDCYRPGNGTRLGQRDSTDRVFQGYDYSNPLFYTTSTQKG